VRDILEPIVKWWTAGETFGLATVVRTFSSAPREPGAALAVSGGGEVVGSVSGGCVEGAVYELAGEVMATGQPVLQTYGVSDDDAFAVGLTCGGIIDIFVEPVDRERFAELGPVAAAVRDGQPAAVATVIDGPGKIGARRVIWPAGETGAGSPAAPGGPGASGTLGAGDRLDQAVDDDARGMLAQGVTGVRRYGPDGERRRDELGEIAMAVERGEPVAVATVISGPGKIGARRVIWGDVSRVSTGGLGAGERLDAAVDDDVRGMLAQGLTGIRRYGEHGERRGDELSVFVNSFAPPPRMLVFGAIDFAAAVARAGKFLGYRVTVCDARPVFATAARFPEADEVITDWPHRYLSGITVDERTVICVLTHDPKFDVPLLEVALRTPAAYVGAMGSRRTHEDRLARLREAGLTGEELARLRSPIGLDLGARTPEETAVAIAAELIQLRWGGSGRPLTATTGRIHHG